MENVFRSQQQKLLVFYQSDDAVFTRLLQLLMVLLTRIKYFQ